MSMMVGPTQPLTAQTEAELNGFVDETQAATAKYADPNVARADGYTISDAAAQKPGDYIHLSNPANFGDGSVMDPSKPESLMYRLNNDGSWTLAGVMYWKHLSDATPPVGNLVPWHQHTGLMPGEMTHVWFNTPLSQNFGMRGDVPQWLENLGKFFYAVTPKAWWN
jgi:hypothetical protein